MTRILRADGWNRVDLLERIPSTNAHAAGAATPWHIVVAHEQSAGRGRLDRSWQVPAGAAVTMSVTVPLPHEAGAWGWVPLFAGSVVLDAVTSLFPEGDFSLKWPNDVLAREAVGARAGEWAKIAGILCQVVPAQSLVVIGIGINVGQTREELPVETATSLRLLGCPASRDDVIKDVSWRLQELAHSWDNAATRSRLRQRVRSSCSTLGADVVVHTSGGEAVRTRALGIDEDGRLVTRVPQRFLPEGPRVMQDTVSYSVADIEHIRPATKVRSDG